MYSCVGGTVSWVWERIHSCVGSTVSWARIYWVFRHSLLGHRQHMIGARGERSTETLLYFVLMLWVMALSVV
jgi:hypothetical protein